MEGAAVALTCLRYGIECLEIRGISNMVDERNLGKWKIKLAVDNAQDFVLQYLEEISSKIDS
jgi:futalosine hydrolase